MVKAPARDPSDFCIAHSAEPVLFMPEKAKRASTPKRFLHMGSFAFLERFYESGSCVQKNCASLGVHPTNLGPIWVQ